MVIAVATNQSVVARPAIEVINASGAKKVVVAFVPDQDIVTFVAVNGIVSEVSIHDVITVAGEHPVIAKASIDIVIAAVAKNNIATHAALDVVGRPATKDPVVPVVAFQTGRRSQRSCDNRVITIPATNGYGSDFRLVKKDAASRAIVSQKAAVNKELVFEIRDNDRVVRVGAAND